MKFDGKQYRHSKKVVTLPRDMWNGEHKNYVAFGRVCSKDTPGAVKTEWSIPIAFFEEEDEKNTGPQSEPVYALPILPKVAKGDDSKSGRGYSLTHLMYGADGMAYLYLDCKCYVRNYRKAQKEREANEASIKA